MSDIVERARELLAGITPGPWTWDGDTFADAAEHKCPHGTQWTDHGPHLVRGNEDGSAFDEWSADDMVITSNGYDASGLEIKTADAEFIAAAPQLVADLADRIESAESLLRALVDADDCWFDHNGDCQAHGFFDGPCAHEQAKQFLGMKEADRG
ncbi:hypothetical protein [Mycolicibacterium fortuitum]|uniref:hypothetical protein n=1 Tax=Mycolicibacterium fortuitum TaxID=1766 RepID=UPI00241F2B75|nr:hypothetical protein [Mycolicibacterium fortuitum]MDG5773906.1 hypothetical protein [Mycolicibacterium fortuitum]MDG5779709.1 hypothetical protein [Mycolicibacterium fortuitum]